MVTVMFFNFSAHAKIKDQIYINNGVALNFGYSFERDSMEHLKAKLNRGVWYAELGLITKHNSCINPYLKGITKIITSSKKTNKRFKVLEKELSNYAAFYKKTKNKKMSREYFRKALFFSEKSRLILEKINWDEQPKSALESLRALRACYFLYHGGLNNLGEAEKSYVLGEYKDKQRELKFKALGLKNKALKEFASAFKRRESKKGDKRRTKSPVFFYNINPNMKLGEVIGYKKIKKINSALERFQDYDNSCECLKEYSVVNEFCGMINEYDLKSNIFNLANVADLVYVKIANDKKIKIELDEYKTHKVYFQYIKDNRNNYKKINKALYKEMIKSLEGLSLNQKVEPIMCITDSLTNNKII
jgi:hypothetical protein